MSQQPDISTRRLLRGAARQEQFLEVVSAEEARRASNATSISRRCPASASPRRALGRVLAHDVIAPIDVPPFDRANVDGFALRAADTAGASDAAPRACVSTPR